jgi:uncharacterized protein (TIGR02266 family)
MESESSQGGGKRRHERIKLSWNKSVVNLSEGGMYVRTDEPRRLGSIVYFEIKLDADQAPIQGTGRVIRVLHKGGAGTSGDPPGMALEFVELTPESRERIRRFIALKQLKSLI